MRVYLNEALASGVGWAKEKARQEGADFATVEVRSQAIADAANYAIERVPAAVRHFKLDETRVRQMIEARLGGA